ncbi:hypothetical protein [Fodinicurvata halophila]|uniref:hypothetical protein n=1 Tax=Fodinicurvata halophila TaxID=1419723 RepID=UPI00363A1768
MTRAQARRRLALQRATAASETAAPAAWQERQAPTTAVEVRLGQRLERQGDGRLALVTLSQVRTRRRRVDARLWDGLSHEEQAAAECIWQAFAVLARGMGLASCALPRERVDGTPADGEGARRLVDLYFRWARRCTAEGSSTPPSWTCWAMATAAPRPTASVAAARATPAPSSTPAWPSTAACAAGRFGGGEGRMEAFKLLEIRHPHAEARAAGEPRSVLARVVEPRLMPMAQPAPRCFEGQLPRPAST